MTVATKDWKNAPDTTTPLNAAGMEDLERRMLDQDAFVAGRYGLLVPWRGIVIPTATAAATLFLPEGASSGLAAGTTNSPLSVVYLDPADVALTDFTTKYRVRAVCLTDAVAPAVTFTVGLYPITAVAGGNDVITMTAGAVVAGSTVAFATQAASTRGQNNSGDFTAPAAGWYALGVVISGLTATNSREVISACLQARNIP
jgi:hypothetical protein